MSSSPEAHIVSIISRENVSNGQDYTWWTHPSIAPAQFLVPPKDILTVCSLAITVCWIVRVLYSYVTSCSNCNQQNIPVSTRVLECDKWCNTSNLATTFVFFLSRHDTTDTTYTPGRLSIWDRWNSITCAILYQILGIIQAPFSIWQHIQKNIVFLSVA